MGRRAKGEGTIFKDSNNYYVARIAVGKDPETGKTKHKVFKSKKKSTVVEKMNAYKLLAAQGFGSVDPTSLDVFMRSWLENVKSNELKPTSYDRAERTIEINILPRIGHYSIGKLTPEIIQAELINDMRDTPSPSTHKPYSFSTINKAYVYLHACLQYAVNTKKLLLNPCDAVVLPTKKKAQMTKTIRFFNDDEISKFKEAALAKSPKKESLIFPYAYAFLFDMYSGLRVGELVGVRWKNVDFDNRRIYIEEQIIQVLDRDDVGKNGNPKLKPILQNDTKTSRSRYVPLSRTALECLTAMKPDKIEPDNFVINNSTKLLRSSCMATGYRRICQRAGIENPLGIHTLRHTFASMLIRKEVDIKAVSEILGHTSVSFTYNTYVHLIEEQKSAAVAKLDDM